MPLPEKNWVLLSQAPSGTFIITRTPLVLVDCPNKDKIASTSTISAFPLDAKPNDALEMPKKNDLDIRKAQAGGTHRLGFGGPSSGFAQSPHGSKLGLSG
jgi:hypothetical protein